MRILIAIALLVWTSAATLADPTDTDKAAIQTVIQKQIDAFNSDDANSAFSHASPMIRFMFRTPQFFMVMVRTGYPQIYRAEKLSFLKLEETDEGTIQRVMVTAQDGTIALARYRMLKHDDGSWLINGCKVDKPGAI